MRSTLSLGSSGSLSGTYRWSHDQSIAYGEYKIDIESIVYNSYKVLDFVDQTLALLRPQYAGRFELWAVRCLYPKPHTVWCARRVGEPTACINASSPEELISAIAEQESA